MIGASAAYTAGLFFASFFVGISGILLFAVTAALVAAVGIRCKFSKGDYLLLAVCFLTACGVSAFSKASRSEIISYDGKEGSFAGEITEMRELDGDKASYILSGKINGEISAKVRYYCEPFEADYGDVITLNNCLFSEIKGDYIFDAESLYYPQKVFLQAENAESITLRKTDSRIIRNFLADYREKMTMKFCKAAGAESGMFLAGMIFGGRQEIDNDVKNTVYRVGIGHVLTVSGLHVSVIALAFMYLFGLLRLNKLTSVALMNVVMALLIITANSPVSAIRAAIMMNFILSAGIFRRQNDTLNSLAAAVLLICLVNPYAVYSTGFWLSVSGTFGIGVFGQYMVKGIEAKNFAHKLLRDAVVMVCITLSVMPFTMLFFDEVSLISPISNIVVLPLCTFAMLLGIVFVFSGGLIPTADIAGVLIKIVLSIADRLSHLRFAYFSASCREAVIVAFFGAAVVLVIYFVLRSRTAVCVACSAVLSVVIVTSGVCRNIRRDKCTAAVLGRGANAVLIVSYRGNTDIIDLSGHYKSSDYAEKYLKRNGIQRVSDIILTERAPSQYACYKSIESVGEWISVSDIGAVNNDKVRVVGENSVIISHGDFTIEYSDRTVKLEIGGKNVEIAPIKSEDNTESDITVLYGNAPEDYAFKENPSIFYTDTKHGKNNFEIVFSEKSDYRIRRL